MHYEVITDKQIYSYEKYSAALRMFQTLQSFGIDCVLKRVYKARAL